MKITKHFFSVILMSSMFLIGCGPKDADNHYSKGSILEGMKDTAAAYKCYQTALQLDSNFISAAYGLAFLNNVRNNYK